LRIQFDFKLQILINWSFSKCPDNPKGLFPNGGACKFCSSVEHYARDCPERQKDNLTLNKNVSVKKIQSFKRGHFEDLSDDDNDFRPQQKVVNVAKKNKVVKF
jgi:zinc finger CCHC domain-containing protein 9